MGLVCGADNAAGVHGNALDLYHACDYPDRGDGCGLWHYGGISDLQYIARRL